MSKPDARAISEKDRRTTDVGLFNYAESYLLCAEKLASQNLNGLRFSDPIEFLFYHSIELLLKSFLRHKSFGTYKLEKDFGHNFSELIDECNEQGLGISKSDSEAIQHIHNNSNLINARYIETGFKQVLPMSDLQSLCSRLRTAVETALTSDGVPLRPISHTWDEPVHSCHKTFPNLD